MGGHERPMRSCLTIDYSFLRADPRSLDSFGMLYREAAEHDADHGEADKGASLAGVPLVVACQATVTAVHASVRSTIQRFGSTTKRPRSERLTISSFQVPVLATKACIFRSLIATIPDDAFDEWKPPSGLPQQQFTSVAILDIGGMDIDAQQQA